MKHLIMGTAGHVDHGKTSLIKALTAIDCDTHKEEKKRGITINLGFAHLDLPTGDSIGIIDVPGHRDFINTMVGGACGIDFVLLVIAADAGIMPQTIEHLNIIKSLGVKNGLVVLTKTDLVDEELIEIAKLEIMELLENTSLANAPIIGVSSVTGTGISELITAISEIVPQVPDKANAGLFRMYIDRVFNVKGFGTVVTGSVLSGEIQTGKDLYLLPGNYEKLKIRNIQRHGVSTNTVYAGDRAAINVVGAGQNDFQTGMVLSSKILEPTEMTDACINLFDTAATLNLWSTVSFHSGTFECQAKMHLLDKDELAAGETGIVQLHLTAPAILLNGDKFIIRNSASDKTLGGGLIIDSNPLHHRKRTPQLIDGLQMLVSGVVNEGKLSEQIKIELFKDNVPLTTNELAQKLNKPVAEISAALGEVDEIYASKYIFEDTHIIIYNASEKNASEKILSELEAYHKKQYIFSDGLATNELFGKFSFTKNKTGKIYLELLLNKMEKEGKISKFNNTWIIKGHTAKVDDKIKSEIDWLENEIKKYDLLRPVLKDIEENAALKGIAKEKIKIYLDFLARNKTIVFHDGEIIHCTIIDKVRKILLTELVKKPEGIHIRDFRQLIDATKKICPVFIGIFEDEKVVSTIPIEFGCTIHITEKGKKLL
ncbi:MAG: selenocysteine-specific translation elongation factor [Bacteroidetes bacterium GWF2_38_335]|nr:MAG: selenocysteine-specific translation elongation factor [Bacteroidetes bacterium GWF2_38_335]OFY81417.1 MAG: selenocysteine-specific translation elongation factor [Bacteroidetes bacterium RIFOXYA12_FULL_38_20]HBS85544.1 selenocysteine-specific translation elongation factor [Bacteroidales bacterium]